MLYKKEYVYKRHIVWKLCSSYLIYLRKCNSDKFLLVTTYFASVIPTTTYSVSYPQLAIHPSQEQSSKVVQHKKS